MSINIRIEQLEFIFKLLIEKAKNDQIKTLSIDIDYYWIIMSDDWEDFSSNSTPDPAVGSLVDDWESLQKILTQEHIVTYVDYDRFASILRAISETIMPSKDISYENNYDD